MTSKLLELYLSPGSGANSISKSNALNRQASSVAGDVDRQLGSLDIQTSAAPER
jgi:hypothetical protein